MLYERVNGHKIAVLEPSLPPMPQEPKPSKYRNIKTVVDGVTFASRKEAERYTELRLLEKAGQIHGLQCQKRFELFPKSEQGRALYYIADFTYLDRKGEFVVEDVKGGNATKTQIYRLKKRILVEKYGIQIQEI